MSTRTVTRPVEGELINDKGTRNITVLLKITEHLVDEIPEPVKYTLEGFQLEHMSGLSIADGPYTLRFPFNRATEEHKVRVVSSGLVKG